MSDSARLLLITPLVQETDGFIAGLRASLSGDGVAAVLLRLAAADERTLINRVKSVASLAATSGAALVVAAPAGADLAAVAVRGGADGAHAEGLAGLTRLRDALGDRSLGVGGLRTRDEAMGAGETGVDYLLFGEPRPDGFVPDRDATFERAAWWAEIFAPPCAVYAASLADVPDAARTGAEFVALGEVVWRHPEGPGAAIDAAIRSLATARQSVPA